MERFAAELRRHVRRAGAPDVEPGGGWHFRRRSSVERGFSRRAPVTALASVLAVVACARGDHAADEVPAPYADAVDELSAFIEAEMATKELDAVSIALVDDQRIIWSTGFGYARPTDSVAATAETVYRVGSVSKLFTDIAVMQRVEAGELELDAPVQAVLPEFAPADPFGASGEESPSRTAEAVTGTAAGGAITLRQLMAHRAGLVREPPVGHYFDDSAPSLEATVASLNDTRLIYPPGERTKYSNAGIAVVGRVLETLAGQPFADALEDAVLRPAGLERSSFSPRSELMNQLATATMWTYDGRTFEAPRFELGMAPAGSMYSTVEDLVRFLSVLFADGEGPGGRVLSPEFIEAMWTPQFSPANMETGFGLGFALGRLDGHRSVGHGGAIYGFATKLAGLPDEKLGVAVITTTDIANVVTDRIADHALRLMLAARDGSPLPDAEMTQPLPDGFAASLEGRWQGAGDAGVDLVEREGRLLLTPVRGGFRTELRAHRDGPAGSLEGGAADPRGPVELLVSDDRLGYGLRVALAGDALVIGEDTLRRVRNGEPRSTPPAAPEATPARGSGLIGEYGWDHNTLYILERDGVLNALIEWFFLYPLEQVSPEVYRFPSWGLYDGETLTFTRDASGTATQVSVEGVVFPRRDVGTAAGETFRITPLRPVAELREAALDATPPVESGTFREPDLVELRSLDPSIRYDIRYATMNNFMSAVFYTEPHALLQRPAAEALVRAHEALEPWGYGLLIHDAYRPWYVTKMFWDATPEDMKQFVADPSSGSRHNRGAAVDLTLYDRGTGEVIEMVGGYDEFSPRSYPDYPGGTSRQRWHRELLRDVMEAEGFSVYEWEWWHFDFGDWRAYPILNQRFDQIGGES